ncbi:phosphopantetheine-binding protein [Myxococcota bacterium]|nr:phosphopantetheine-binding protein [Myxococcota bacterium]
MDEALMLAKVLEVLRAEFPSLKRVALGPDTALVSSGLLDSFGVVTLLAALDGAFGVEIDVEQVELDQFDTPARIAALCRASLVGRPGGGRRG